MPRGKSSKLKPFQKLLTIMAHGKPVTIQEIDTLLGKEIYMYRLSTYMWHIKVHMNGVIKAIKDGRVVTAYQLVNAADIKKEMDRLGLNKSGFTPGQIEKKPSKAKTSAKVKKDNAPDITLQSLGINVEAVKKPKKSKSVVESSNEELEVVEMID